MRSRLQSLVDIFKWKKFYIKIWSDLMSDIFIVTDNLTLYPQARTPPCVQIALIVSCCPYLRQCGTIASPVVSGSCALSLWWDGAQSCVGCHVWRCDYLFVPGMPEGWCCFLFLWSLWQIWDTSEPSPIKDMKERVNSPLHLSLAVNQTKTYHCMIDDGTTTWWLQ